MGGSTLPTASTPGYGSITRNGRTFVGCDCVIQFLLAGERLGLAKGLLKEGLDIVQIVGNAAASAGVHRLGAAFDVMQLGPEWVIIWREMGASFWPRIDDHPGVAGDLWDNNTHGHGGIDCAHDSLIAYQMTAYWRGYSGLGKASSGRYAGQWGYGSKDKFTYRPKVRRTWREGIAWADAETARIKAASIKEEDIMATAAELRQIISDELDARRVRDAADRVLGGIPAGSALSRTVNGEKPRLLDSGDGNYLVGILRSIAGKVGAPIDEQAIASTVLAGLAPAVSDAVKAAVAAGVPTGELADAVVARLGERLASS